MAFDGFFREGIGEDLGNNAYNFIFRDILKFDTNSVNLGGTLTGNQINDFSSSFGGNLVHGSSGGLDSWLYYTFFSNDTPVLTGSLQYDFVFGLLVPTVFMLLFISFMTTDIFKLGPKLKNLTYITIFIAAIEALERKPSPINIHNSLKYPYHKQSQYHRTPLYTILYHNV